MNFKLKLQSNQKGARYLGYAHWRRQRSHGVCIGQIRSKESLSPANSEKRPRGAFLLIAQALWTLENSAQSVSMTW